MNTQNSFSCPTVPQTLQAARPAQPILASGLRRLSVALVLAGTGLHGLASAAASENLIPNGDLEEVTAIQSNGLPRGMTYWSSIQDRPIAKAYLSQEEKTSGDNSLCIERLDEPKGVSRVGVTKLIPVEPGKRYCFSCKIKSTETRPMVLIYMHDGNKTELPFGLVDAETATEGAMLSHNGAILTLNRDLVTDPDGFNKAELTFTAPPEAQYFAVQVDFSSNANGKAWFDDFELLPLD